MALVPGDPVVGGTVLRRAAIQSPNFVLNTSGWSINQDGTAQFTGLSLINGIFESISGSNLTFEIDQFGDLVWFNSHGAQAIAIVPAKEAIFIYADTGSAMQGALVASVAAVSGTDAFGNAFQAGITSYGSGALAGDFVQLLQTVLSFQAATGFAGTIQLDGAGGLDLDSGRTAGGDVDVSAAMWSKGRNNITNVAQFRIAAGSVVGPQTSALLEVQGAVAVVGALNTTGLNVVTGGGGLSAGVGNVDIPQAGSGLRVAEGSNAKQGIATLSAGTKVVSNTSVTANSRFFLTAQDNNSTGALRVSARTAGTSFTITSSNAADSGVVAYQIFEPG